MKKLHIGYKNLDKPARPGIKNLVIKPVNQKEELQEVLKLFDDTYGETDFLEEDTWYRVAEMQNLVALSGEKLLGCATWAEQKDRLFLLGILTVPEYFRSGVGTALLNKIKNIAKELHKPKIFVPLSNDDLVSYVFYHKNGFKLKGIDVGLPEKRHGKEEMGFWGLPCRDEFYLEFQM